MEEYCAIVKKAARQQHTPEPWYTSGQAIWAHPVPADNEVSIAICNGNRCNPAANASRIVACVNACAGIPTETLEGDQDALKSAVSLREEAIEQRDELAAALRDLMASCQKWAPQLDRSRARAAIAKLNP